MTKRERVIVWVMCGTVVCGGVLSGSDYLQRQQIVSAMSKPGVSSVSLRPELTELYRFGCWLTGTGAIAAAIYFSRRVGGG